MAFTHYRHDARAQVALPPMLRGALELRLRRAAPIDFFPLAGPPEVPLAIQLVTGENGGIPASRVLGWAPFGEWFPGHLFILAVSYGRDGDAAVILWYGELDDGYGPRVLSLAEVDLDYPAGKLRP